MKNVCVCGSSSAALDQIYYDTAFTLGAELAKAGFGLVFGAGDIGVMGATARGVHSIAGGHVTGIIPSFMNVDGIPYQKCDDCVITETMRERKQMMEDRSDAFIAAPGGIGTFEEFFEVLTLKQLKRHKKAIVLLNVAHYYDPLQQMLKCAVAQRFAKPASLELYYLTEDPVQAVEYIRCYKYTEFADKWFTDIGRR